MSSLINVMQLINAYFDDAPSPSVAAQRVCFGASGHRRSAFDRAFNEWHVLAIIQAICNYRESMGIDGPLFLGIDTHALSRPACATALEVLAANGVEVMLATRDEHTPTPVISHAILAHNRGRSSGLADGIVVTPSHNPRAMVASNTTRRTAARREGSSQPTLKRRPIAFLKQNTTA